jgi:hypothetical protein
MIVHDDVIAEEEQESQGDFKSRIDLHSYLASPP